MRIQGIAIWSLMIIISTPLIGLDLTKINFSYKYDTQSSIKMAHRVIENESGITVFFRVSGDSLSNWKSTILAQEEYGSTDHDTLTNVSVDTIIFNKNNGYFKLNVGSPGKSILLISIYDLNKGEYFLEAITVKSPVGFPSIYPSSENGLPIFSSYITSDEVMIKGNQSLHAYAYLDDFQSADPAMGAMKTISPNIDIDSSFYFNGSVSSFEDYKFYLIQEDTLAQNALTILKCPTYYPEFHTIEELIGPLTYITTASEIKSMTSSYNRKAFEIFWIDTYGTKFRAKNAIKRFYDEVESANLLFTDYKQGWKTDRGMIYIVFGKPDQVRTEERLETWIYNNGVEFEFIRISTLFAPVMYSLKRNRKYENLWYQQVGEIRKGL